MRTLFITLSLCVAAVMFSGCELDLMEEGDVMSEQQGLVAAPAGTCSCPANDGDIILVDNCPGNRTSASCTSEQCRIQNGPGGVKEWRSCTYASAAPTDDEPIGVEPN